MSGTRELTSIVRRCRFFFSTLAALACFAMPTWAGPVTLFVSDQATDVIHRYNATTGAQILPDIPLLGVTGLATGPSGDLFAVSAIPSQDSRVKMMGTMCKVRTGWRSRRAAICTSPITTLSNVHEYDTAGNSVASLGAADPSAFFSQPTDVAFDSIGDLYVVNPGNGNVLKSLGGTQPFTEFFPTQTGGLTIPSALTFGPDGKLYVLDSSNSGGPAIRRYTAAGAADGTFITYAAIDFQPNDIAFGPDGKLYVSGLNLDTADGQVLRYLPDGTADGALVASGPSYPTFMAFSVPEPASITLLAMAGVGLLWAASRSRGT